MNKNPFFLATPVPGARFRNLHAASLGRLLAAIASLLIVSLSLCHAAQSCNLAWDASSDPNIAGYKLRYGTTSGNPSQTIDVGKTTTATVSNLNDGTTYYFTATSYTAAGVESPPSNQVSHTTAAPSANKYVLTVTNGSGGGNYAAGTQVTVSANVPAGQQFAAWTEDYQILANPSSSTTTATMPARAVRITATYVTAPPPAPANQVTALSFNEGSGTAAADNSGSGHSGTLVNGPTWTAGKFGNGLSLDGTNDYVSVSNPSTLNFGTGGFTIALWIKRQATGVEQTIFSKTANDNWTSGGKELFIRGSDNRLGFGSFGVGEVFSAGTITNDGLWHHVAVTFTDSSNAVTLYIDGVASGSGTVNLPADDSSHVVKIGSNPTGTHFAGQMDEFRIFSRALSPSEVQSIINNAIQSAAP